MTWHGPPRPSPQAYVEQFKFQSITADDALGFFLEYFPDLKQQGVESRPGERRAQRLWGSWPSSTQTRRAAGQLPSTGRAWLRGSQLLGFHPALFLLQTHLCAGVGAQLLVPGCKPSPGQQLGGGVGRQEPPQPSTPHLSAGLEFDRWLNTPGWPPFLPDLSPGQQLMKPADELAELWAADGLNMEEIEAVDISAWKTYQMVYFLDRILQKSPLPEGEGQGCLSVWLGRAAEIPPPRSAHCCPQCHHPAVLSAVLSAVPPPLPFPAPTVHCEAVTSHPIAITRSRARPPHPRSPPGSGEVSPEPICRADPPWVPSP